jgi:hypothetical protein
MSDEKSREKARNEEKIPRKVTAQFFFFATPEQCHLGPL